MAETKAAKVQTFYDTDIRPTALDRAVEKGGGGCSRIRAAPHRTSKIQSTEDLLNEETDEYRRYRYETTLQGLEQAKSDVEESIQRELDAEDDEDYY